MTKKRGRTNNANDDSSTTSRKKQHEEEHGPHVIVGGDKVRVKRAVNAYILY
jgi:hypothetical protein